MHKEKQGVLEEAAVDKGVSCRALHNMNEFEFYIKGHGKIIIMLCAEGIHHYSDCIT